MTIQDYTHFITNYAHDPCHNFRTARETHFGIVICAVRELFVIHRYTSMLANPTTEVLDAIQMIATAIHSMSSPKRIVPAIDDDRSWLQDLWRSIHEIHRLDKPRFRQLLHTLEKCFCKGLLTGDPKDIRRYLHSLLIPAHDDCQVCDDGAECPWIKHACKYNFWGDPGEDCPLLLSRPSSPSQPPAIGDPRMEDERRSSFAEQETPIPANLSRVTHESDDDSRPWRSRFGLRWLYRGRKSSVDVETGKTGRRVAEVDEKSGASSQDTESEDMDGGERVQGAESEEGMDNAHNAQDAESDENMDEDSTQGAETDEDMDEEDSVHSRRGIHGETSRANGGASFNAQHATLS